MSRSAKLLREILISLDIGSIPDEIKIKRLHPGHWQRSAGAWSFCVEDSRGNEIAGSQWNVREIIEAYKKNGKVFFRQDLWGAISIYPM